MLASALERLPPVAVRVLRLAERRVVPLAAAVLALAAALVGWRFFQGGGPFFDDFWLRAEMLYGTSPEQRGVGGQIAALADITGYRPTSVPWFLLLYNLAGDSRWPYAVIPSVVVVVLAVVLLVVLRRARMPLPGAFAAALLLTTMPYAAVTRFWLAGTQLTAGAALLLGGWLLGARAMERERIHAGWAAASVALVVAGVLMYELVAGLLVLLPVFYAVVRRRVDGAVIGLTAATGLTTLAAVLLLRARARTDAESVATWDDHAEALVRESFFLVRSGVWPDGRWAVATAVVVLVALIASALVVTGRRSGVAAARAALVDGGRTWGLWLVGGGAATLLGYLLLVPANGWYHPLQPGQGTRTNAVAVIGMAVGMTGVLGLVATAVTAGLDRHARTAGAAVLVALAVLLAGDLAGQTRAQGDQYVAAQRQIDATLDALQATWPAGVPPRTTVLSFAAPGNAAPNVPSFGVSWDLNGAVRLLFRTGAVEGYPVVGNQPVVCGPDGVALPLVPAQEPQYGPAYTRPYGRVVFVNAATRDAERVDGRRECGRILRRFPPGSFLGSS